MQPQMIDLFYEGIIQKEQFVPLLSQQSVLVPIPLYSSKFRKRGYNQAVLLADGLARRFDIPVVDCLKRVKHTKTQVGLSKDDRKENVAEAFVLKSDVTDSIKQYQNVFLVDDVVTTGATLKEAAKVLKKAGCKSVWGLTLAHGE